VSSIEYYTALSLLEASAASLSIPAADGTNRFKNGIFVESFEGATFGEIYDQEYSVSIDPIRKIARPSYFADNFGLVVANTVGASVTAKFATAAYTDEVYLEQNYATEPVVVVPDITFNGVMDVYPVEFRDIYQNDSYISGGTSDGDTIGTGGVVPTNTTTSTTGTTSTNFDFDTSTGNRDIYFLQEY
jgi:hypothetical protein